MECPITIAVLASGQDDSVHESPTDHVALVPRSHRYAWSENPCCPSVNRAMIPCPPNSCPIQAANSTLPAVPFWATIINGQCAWISTQGPPKK